LIQGIPRSEQALPHVLSDHAHVLPVLNVEGQEEAPALGLDAGHPELSLGGPDDGDPFHGLGSVLHVPARAHGGIDDGPAAQLVLQRHGLTEIDVGAVPKQEEIVHDDPRHARDIQHVRAHRGKALPEPVAETVGRGHGDGHGHDADE
jgi:hypothetical protein